MPELQELKDLLEKVDTRLDKMDNNLTEVKTVLIGVPGTESDGLCGEVKRNSESIRKLWIAVIVMASSVGGGVYAAVKALMG